MPGAASGSAAKPSASARALSRFSEHALARSNALLAFAVRVASAAILFASQVLLARWMGGHEYGIYVHAWTWLLILGTLSTCGFNFAAIRLVAELRETRRFDELRGFLAGGRLLALGVAAAIATVAMVALSFQPDAPGAGFGGGTMLGLSALAIIMLAIPAAALSDVHDGIGRGSAQMLSGLLGPYVIRPMLVLSLVVVLHGAGITLDAATVAMAAVLAVWSASAMQASMVGRQVARFVSPGARVYNFRQWFATALPLMVISLSDLALQTTDVIVIASLLSPTDAGIYFASAKTMGLILFVHYAVGSSMANRFAAINARGDAAAMRLVARQAVSWTFWPSLVLGLALLAVGRPALALFGPDFVGGYPVMCVLVGGFLIRAAVGPVDFLLNMTGGQAACARTLASVALLNLVLTLVLVPVAGLVGAALAVSASLMVGAVVNYRIASRRLGFGFAVWSLACRDRPL